LAPTLALPKLLSKFSFFHNFLLVGPKIIKIVFPQSIFLSACSQKVSILLKKMTSGDVAQTPNCPLLGTIILYG
jgi:hypothetical protein